MLDCKTFYSIPNWLDLERLRLPIIVSGRKPACWHYGEIDHLSAVCSGKKAPEKHDHDPCTFLPVKANYEKEAHVVSPTVRALAPETAGNKNPNSPLSRTGITEDSKAEFLRQNPTCGSSIPKVVSGGHQ